MSRPTFPLRQWLTICLTFSASMAFAHTGPQATELDRIVVTGQRDQAPVAPTLSVERERLAQIPGATNLIDLRKSGRQGTLRDALDYQPGLVVQEFFGGIDQPRLNVRGSGIQSNPVNRGIILLQDGLPLNEADGSFVIGLVEQRNTAFISARRGANAISPGATTLGGEIDFHSMTGADERGRLRLEAGSYGKQGGQLAYGSSSERGDWRLSASHDENDGWRTHSDGKRQSVQFNTGWHAGEHFANRTQLSWTDLFFHIPGPVPKARIHSAPRSVMGQGNTPMDALSNILRRDPQRDSRQWRLGNRSEWGRAQARQLLGVWWQQTDDLFHNPTVHHLRETRTRGMHYQLNGQMAAWDYHLGAAYTDSAGTRALYANNPANGTCLQRFGDYALDAASLDVSAGVSWRLGDQVRLLADSKWSRARRDAREHLSGQRLDRRYTHASPRLGLIWHAHATLRVFANLSRSNEVPSWWEIISADAPANNPAAAHTALQPLQVQRAESVEIGANGHFGNHEQRLHWQLTLYRSQVDDELMSMVNDDGTRVGTFNYTAGTTHQGVEAGVDGHWEMLARHALEYRLAWTYSDFSFDGGSFSGNQIAGVPSHMLSAELLLNSAGWHLGPTVRWLPSATPIDHANTRTIYQDSYALLGFKLDYTTPDDRWQVFVHADNLTDRRYASSYVIRNQGTLAQPGFLPGVGRHASLGVTWRF